MTELSGFNPLALSRRSVLLLGASGLIAQTTGLARAQAAKRDQVIVGFSQEPTVFNPLMAGFGVNHGVWWNVFSPLWGVDPAGALFPVLAREVPDTSNGGISEDGLNWKIVLRDDVKWHDGTPFTAEDVKFTIELINNSSFRAGRRAGHSLVRDIVVESPTEIRWRLERPFAPYLAILGWTFMVPRHLLADVDDPNTAPFNSAPVGTGPFKWNSRMAGDHLILSANDEYFDGRPSFSNLIFKYVPDLNVLYTQFAAGELDYVGIQGIPVDKYEEATALSGKNIVVTPLGFIEGVLLNLERPQFKDLRVRQALYMSMDKKTIFEVLYKSLSIPTESVIPTHNWAYDADLPSHVFDPAAAAALLDEAGWKPGQDGIREKDGVRLEFNCATTAGNRTREQLQQYLAQSWQVIGIKMNITNFPAAVLLGEYWTKGEYDLFLIGYSYTAGPDPDITDYFHSSMNFRHGGAGQNTMGYSNPDVDRLLEEGAAKTDREARKSVYAEVQRLIREDLPFLPLHQTAMVQGLKADLGGFRSNPNVLSDCWNAKDWSWG